MNVTRSLGILFPVLCLSLLCSCSGVELRGCWEGGAGHTAYLNDGDRRIDSAVVDAEEQFEFAFRSDSARIYTLIADDASWPVWLDGSQTEVALTCGPEAEGLCFELLRGGREQQVLSKVVRVLEDDQTLHRTIRESFESPKGSGPEYLEALFARMDSMRRAINAQASALLDTTASCGASMVLISDYYLGEVLQLDKAKKAFARIDTALRHTPVWRQTAAKLDRIACVFAEGEAPDIALPAPNGDTLRLRSLRGGWVILDFWASWCVPCMHEMPMLKDLYARFHSKGLTIYGVSSDTKADDWIRTIEREQLVWPQVSGLGAGTQEVRKRYMVDAIPCILLIDPQGQIVSRGLRGEKLRQEVVRHLTTEKNP